MTVAPTGTNTDAGPHIYCGAMHSGFIATFRPGRTWSCILVLMGEVCVFCGSASDAPEHVYPRWFLKLWDQAGPFTAKLDGELLRTRSGAPLTSSKTWRVMLPCCKSCNGDLDRFFEKPAKRPLRTLLRDVQPLEDVADVRRAARWLVKTLSLAAHPSVNHTAFPSRSAMDGNGSISSWGEYPRIVLDSFKIDEIPPDMSLWAAVTDPSNPGLPDPPFQEVILRRTYRPDGMGGSGRPSTTGFGLPDGRLAWFQLVYHPLHDLSHPFESAGLVTRLWPDPPATFDISNRPVLDHRTRLSDVFVDGLIAHYLDPGERSIGNGPPLFGQI